MKIVDIHAQELLDSRGDPTVEAPAKPGGMTTLTPPEPLRISATRSRGAEGENVTEMWPLPSSAVSRWQSTFSAVTLPLSAEREIVLARASEAAARPLEEWTRSESASTRSAAAEPLAESTRQVLTCEASDSDVLPRCTQILRHGTS